MKSLTVNDMKQLATSFAKHCCLVAKDRKNVPVAKHIQYPKVPTILSESIVVWAIHRGLLFKSQSWQRVHRGGGADVMAHGKKKKDKIEVKATQDTGGFSTYGAKDHAADYLVWLNFGTAFQKGVPKQVEVVILANPGKHISESLVTKRINWGAVMAKNPKYIKKQKLNLLEIMS